MGDLAAFSWTEKGFPDKENNNDLENKNQRNTNNKTQMFCFVMENIHSSLGADTASDKGQEEERRFSDPPPIFNSAAFVDTENNKGGHIDNNKIND